MSRFPELPRWVTLPASAGIMAMTAFIPELSPLVRGVGFTVGAALFAWSLIGACWHLWRGNRDGLTTWMSLPEALNHLVGRSAWAYSFQLDHGDDAEGIVTHEFFEAAARGEIKVRGRRRTSKHPWTLAAASEEIPQEFWQSAGMQAFYEIYADRNDMREEFRPAVWQRSDLFPQASDGYYAKVSVSKGSIFARWPKAPWQRRRKINALTAAYRQWVRLAESDPDTEFEVEISRLTANG